MLFYNYDVSKILQYHHHVAQLAEISAGLPDDILCPYRAVVGILLQYYGKL